MPTCLFLTRSDILQMNMSVLSMLTNSCHWAWSESLIPEQVGNKFLIYSGPLYQTVSVGEVGGGNETNPLVHSDIGNAALKEAITRSLKINNYLSSSKETSKYALNVFLVEIDLPQSGYTTTITTFVKYKLVDIKSKRVVFVESVDDIFIGPTRLKIVQENAMKKNIALFLEKLLSINRQ